MLTVAREQTRLPLLYLCSCFLSQIFGSLQIFPGLFVEHVSELRNGFQSNQSELALAVSCVVCFSFRSTLPGCLWPDLLPHYSRFSHGNSNKFSCSVMPFISLFFNSSKSRLCKYIFFSFLCICFFLFVPL